MFQLLSHVESGGAISVLLDALLDSALILPVLFLAHVLMTLIDKRAGQRTRKSLSGPLSPLIGTAAGVLPQCGFSVAATRLYAQSYIPLGALIAVYISTSDEALLILLSAGSAQKILPLLAIKTVFALIAGYGINLTAYLARKSKRRRTENKGGAVLITCTAEDDLDLLSFDKDTHEVPPPPTKQELSLPAGVVAAPYLCSSKTPAAESNSSQHSQHSHGLQPSNSENGANAHPEDCDCGCGCGHHTHNGGKKAGVWHDFVIHPLVHTLKIFAYVLAVNLVLGLIIFFVTPQRFEGFVSGLSVWQPALAALVGLIPNCASGVILAEMYANGLLTLGAAAAGLSAAAGLGYAVLIKEHKNKLSVLLIFLGMFLSSTLVGMFIDLVF